jgi:hypothetical protein
MRIKLQQSLADKNVAKYPTNPAMVWFWFRQLCAIISRAGATFHEIDLALTPMGVSRMLPVLCLIHCSVVTSR